MDEFHFIFIMNESERKSPTFVCPCSNCVKSLHYSIPSLCLNGKARKREKSRLNSNKIHIPSFTEIHKYSGLRTSRSHSRKQKDPLSRENNLITLPSFITPSSQPLSLSGKGTNSIVVQQS